MPEKTKYKYIEFKKFEDGVWLINNHKYNEYLGNLEYNKKWKCWELLPANETGWTEECLVDVVDFIKQLKKIK